ncbi:PAS domain S-box protein [Paraburkholderia sp. SIMBA_049]
MSVFPNNTQKYADGMIVTVAIVELDERSEPILNACSDQFFRMIDEAGLDSHAFPMPLRTLIPDHVWGELYDKLRACFQSGGTMKLEQAFELHEPEKRWRLSLKPLRHTTSGASARQILLTGFDSVPKMRLTRELEVSASRFRAVVDSAYDTIITIDEQHSITLFNRAAENLFGYQSSEVLGRPVETLLPEKFRANHSRNVKQFANSPQTALRSMTPPRMDESNSVFGRHRDGTIIPVEIAISKFGVDDVVEFTAIVRDISDRAQLIKLLKKQARADALTSLPNRREFRDFVARALAVDDILSVFMLDVDSFKMINDNHGLYFLRLAKKRTTILG